LWLQDDSANQSADVNVPSWLSPNEPLPNDFPPLDELKPDEASFGDIPTWLKAAAPQSSIFSEPAVEQDNSQFSSDAPDWLSTFKSVEPAQTSSPFASEIEKDENAIAPAFTENTFESGGDALFTEMPDWLSNASDSSASNTLSNDESMAPSELPSWVQAMRPDNNNPIQVAANFSTDQTLESRGALAGLQGVLPSVPGYVPTSKPKAYSILLQATEEQKAHALLLEQILAAEAEPQPIASYLSLPASRPLRWFIAFAVLMAVHP